MEVYPLKEDGSSSTYTASISDSSTDEKASKNEANTTSGIQSSSESCAGVRVASGKRKPEDGGAHEAKKPCIQPVANTESVLNPKNKAYMIGGSLVKCFVCDKMITRGGISLIMGCVPYSKTGLPKKIGELMGDGFMIIISKDDFLCKRCSTMLNYVDKLEVDLEIIKKALTRSLKTKYNLLDSEEANITVCDTENAALQDKVTEDPQFDVSVFLQSADDSIQSVCNKSSVEEEEEIVTVNDNKKSNAEYGSWEEGACDSEQLAESLKTSNETVGFRFSEYNKSFESQFEAEKHSQNYLTALNTEEAEIGSGDINSSTEKQTLFQCHFCTFQAVNMTFLERHVQKHLTKPIYQCSVCTKRFKSRTYLLKHMNIHKCDVCSQMFNEKTKLLKHLLVHEHSDSKSEHEAFSTVTFEDHQHQSHSSTHNSDFEKKEDPSSEAIETETLSNVENSSTEKDSSSLQEICVNYNKIEELMIKLHADEIPCSTIEEKISNSEKNDPESSTTNDCQKAEESSSCIDRENNSEVFTQIEAHQYLASPDILVKEGNETEPQITDNTDFLEHFSDENTFSSDSWRKEEQDISKIQKIFVCSVCGLNFSSDSELREHLKIHQAPGNKKYECNVCSRIFTSKINLVRHLGKHGTSFGKINSNLCGEEVGEMNMKQHMRKLHREFLQCFYCSEEFTTMKELKQHELAHPENATHRCHLCKKHFSSEIRLKIHLKNIHSEITEDEIYKCNICSKTLANCYNLKRHLGNHEKSERNAKCDICSEMLTDKLHLRQHIEDMHGNVHQCAFCQQTFSNRKMCKAHELSHPERYVYKCDSCPSSFTGKLGLEKHKSVYHRDPNCKFCDKVIADPIKLMHHERRHEMYKNKFPCKHCPKVFRTPSGLKYHMSTHTGKYAVYCEVCGRGLHSEILLEEHMASHTKEARYTCDVCGRNFSARSTYRLHRKWHDDPLPYHCKYCNRRFKHTSIMAVHIRRAHTGERPYKCPHCPQTFSVSSSLHKHIILHTKNYPFICKYCNKGFTTRSKVAWHTAKAHDDYEMVNSKPPACEYKMALKPSEMPSVSAKDDALDMQEPPTKGISAEKFEETVIEEQIVDAGQTIFLFQEGFV